MDTKADLFESGFKVFDDFLGEYVRIGKIVGVFAALPASRSVVDRLRASEISIMSPEFASSFHLQARSSARHKGLSTQSRYETKNMKLRIANQRIRC